DVVPIKGSFGMRALKWIWRELSIVTLPQNLETTILAVKGSAPMQTTAERITMLENSRAAKVARLVAIQTKAADDGETIDGGPAAEEYDGLELDVKKIDGDLGRLRTLEAMNVQKAVPVAPAPPRIVTATSTPPTYSTVRIKSNVEPGTGFVRYCQALAANQGN